ncbi:MAG: sugar phosphate isomerase/epimerase [candidate division NC10 bacterium]|nr:sugar phosphate isomerase/epimerase [candidate division NC10 bacterium]
MRLSIVVTTAESRFSAVAFRGDLAGNLARVKRLGYQGVELSFRDPKTVDVAGLKVLLEKHDLPVVALATGRAWGEDRLSFTDRDPAVRQRTSVRVAEYLDLARDLNAMIILGLIRGRIPDGVKPAVARRWARDAIRRAADTGARHDIRLVIEPINRYETNFLYNIDETLAFLEEVDRPNVGILADTFHMNIEDASISGSLQRAGRSLFHVHVADSNRWAPGCGHLDFTEVLATLHAMRYSGYVSVECLPKPDPESCPRIAIATLRKAASLAARRR